MDYKSFIIQALKNNNLKLLNKYNNITERMVKNNRLNKKYLLSNNKYFLKHYGGSTTMGFGPFKGSRALYFKKSNKNNPYYRWMWTFN